jgi:DNA invertase Pin-like site-specific DNA recombinase
MTILRAAFYMRVSTPKRKKRPRDVEPPKQEQTTANQRPDLLRMAEFHRFDVVREFAAHESTARKRHTFEAMMTAAKKREFDVLLVWAIDRFGRSMAGNVNDVLELERVGIRVMSFAEPWLDTDSRSPVRGLLLSIFSWIAEQERLRRSERTKVALARVRAEGSESGKPIGRPARLVGETLKRAKEMQADGRSIRSISMALRVSRPSVQRALMDQGPLPPVPQTSGAEKPVTSKNPPTQ